MVVVLICDLLLAVRVTFPQLLIYHLLNLWGTNMKHDMKMFERQVCRTPRMLC